MNYSELTKMYDENGDLYDNIFVNRSVTNIDSEVLYDGTIDSSSITIINELINAIEDGSLGGFKSQGVESLKTTLFHDSKGKTGTPRTGSIFFFLYGYHEGSDPLLNITHIDDKSKTIKFRNASGSENVVSYYMNKKKLCFQYSGNIYVVIAQIIGIGKHSGKSGSEYTLSCWDENVLSKNFDLRNI